MNRRGFTLAELLIVTLLLSLVSGAAWVLAQTGRQVWARSDAKLASITDTQRAMSRLTEDLRRARQTNPNPALNLTCTPNLAFTMLDGSTIVYQRLGSNLVRTVNGVNQVVTSGLQAFTWSCLENNVVQVVLTAQTTTAGVTWPQTLTSQVWVQNP